VVSTAQRRTAVTQAIAAAGLSERQACRFTERTSDQKLRWCAAALLAVEHRFRRLKGWAHLPLLERALRANIPPSADAAA